MVTTKPVHDSILARDAAGLTSDALRKLFDEFSASSVQMQRSHEELRIKVEDLKRELAAKDRRLQEKKRLEALGLMVAGVAHEFRNPLGSVSLYVDCLGDVVAGASPEISSEAGGILRKIETAVRHLNRVVEDMLLVTRGSAEASEPCDLHRLLEEALVFLEADLSGAAVHCELSPAGELDATVSGDRDQLVRIFLNVLKNAAQAVASHRPRGEGRIQIDLCSGAAGRREVEVRIADNGPGVPPDRLDRLFVPFYTEKPGGVGLGLYIVHSLLERQGGRVDVDNRPEGGLRVRLTFVREIDAQRAPPATAEQRIGKLNGKAVRLR